MTTRLTSHKTYLVIPHAAFQNMDARPGCPPRQSVEVRYYLIDPAPYPAAKPFGDLIRSENRRQPWKEFLDDPQEKAPQAVADPSKRKMIFWYKQDSAPVPTEVK